MVAAFLPAVRAQMGGGGTPPPIVDVETHSFPMHTFSASPGDAYTRTVAGRFNDDPQTDLVVLRNGKAMLVLNPTIWNAALEYPLSAINDIAVLPGTSKDQILTVDGSGLRAWSRNSALDTYTSSTIGSTAWNGAVFVRAANLDGANGFDFYGINSTGDKILVTLDDGQGGYTTTSFSLSDTPTQLVALQYDGSGDLEIASVDADSIQIHELDGTIVDSTTANTGGVIAAITDSSSTDDTLAIVYDGGAGTEVVRVLSDANGLSTAMNIGNVDPVSMIACDVDDDGDDDLVLNGTTGYRLCVLKNQNGSFSNMAKQWVDYGPGGAAPDNDAWPVATDIDHDGDLDLAVPVQTDEWLALLVNQDIDESTMQPTVNNILASRSWNGTEIEDRVLKLNVDNPSMIPQNATHLEILFYRQESLAAETTPEPAQVHHFTVVAGSHTYSTGIMQFPINSEEETQIFYWVQRFVALDNGEYTEVFPAKCHAFVSENAGNPGPRLNYLTGRGATIEQTAAELVGPYYNTGDDTPGSMTDGGGGGGSDGYGDDDEPEDGT